MTTASRNGRSPDRIRKRGKQPLSCYDIASDHNRGRFNRLIQPGGGCWIWQGGCDKNGYGVLSISIGFGKERKIKAHRLAWVFAHGEIPDGLEVLHTCDIPPCVR